MRIPISGGGVAGLTLAYWLHHGGFTPVVVERSPEGQVGGHGIAFFGTGYDIAKRMGLLQRLEQGRIPADSVAFVNEAGRVRARLERRAGEMIALFLYKAPDEDVIPRAARLGTSTQHLVIRLPAHRVLAPVLRRRFGAGSILAAG